MNVTFWQFLAEHPWKAAGFGALAIWGLDVIGTNIRRGIYLWRKHSPPGPPEER